jgi:hypothetical protein
MASIADTTIVISHYKENLDWVNDIDTQKTNIIVIDKGESNSVSFPTIQVQNIGREAHSFILYIVEHYDTLTEYTIFLQGHPFDHFTNLIDFVNNKEYKRHKLFPITEKTIYIPPGEGTQTFVENIFDMRFQGINFPCGAQYSVHRDMIKFRSKNFWESLLKKMPWKEDTFLPYFFERCWPIIYDTRIGVKDNYLLTTYFQFDN